MKSELKVFSFQLLFFSAAATPLLVFGCGAKRNKVVGTAIESTEIALPQNALPKAGAQTQSLKVKMREALHFDSTSESFSATDSAIAYRAESEYWLSQALLSSTSRAAARVLSRNKETALDVLREPCAALPKLSGGSGSVLLPYADKICWGFDTQKIVRVSSEASADQYHMNSAKWADYSQNLGAESSEALRALGASEKSFYLGNKQKVIEVDLNGAQLSVTDVPLVSLKLEEAPLSYLSRRTGELSKVFVSSGTKIFRGQEKAESKGSYQWQAFQIVLEGEASAWQSKALQDFRVYLLETATKNTTPPSKDVAQTAVTVLVALEGKVFLVEVGEELQLDQAKQSAPQKETFFAGTAFLSSYCLACHGFSSSAQGGLKLFVDATRPNLEVLQASSVQQKIIDRLGRPSSDKLAMPPYDPRPDDAQKAQFLKELEKLRLQANAK